MKDSDIPQISSTWWKKNQPVTLPATGLGEALRKYEAARAQATPTDSPALMTETLNHYDVALAALAGLTPALAKAQSKCNKVLHSSCLKVLTRYPALLIKEKGVLTEEKTQLQNKVASASSECKVGCAKVVSTIIEDVKKLEPIMMELDNVQTEAEDTEQEVAGAVNSQVPNAGDLEVTIADGYVKTARSLCEDIRSKASSAKQKALQDWEKAFQKSLLDNDLSRIRDRADQQISNFDIIIPKAEKVLKAVEASAKAVREMADGGGDIEANFVKICADLEARTQKTMALIRPNFAQAGGDFDRALFNSINFKEKGHPDFGKPELLDEARTAIKRGVTCLSIGRKQLANGRSGFDKTMSSLPDSATPDNPKFSDILAALGNAKTIYNELRDESVKLGTNAEKAAEKFKAAL